MYWLFDSRNRLAGDRILWRAHTAEACWSHVVRIEVTEDEHDAYDALRDGIDCETFNSYWNCYGWHLERAEAFDAETPHDARVIDLEWHNAEMALASIGAPILDAKGETLRDPLAPPQWVRDAMRARARGDARVKHIKGEDGIEAYITDLASRVMRDR